MVLRVHISQNMAAPSWNEGDAAESRRLLDAARIDEIVRELDDPTGTASALMREHLDAARFYLLGAMPAEYQMELDLARGLLPHIDNRTLRRRVADFLRTQHSAAA